MCGKLATQEILRGHARSTRSARPCQSGTDWGEQWKAGLCDRVYLCDDCTMDGKRRGLIW